jgi:AraC-like DNA-binding protein
MFDGSLSFSLIEWLAITGLFQGIVILVYISLRARDWKQASLAWAYFFFLAVSFALQFALRLDDFSGQIKDTLWVVRGALPALCYLLVVQVARLTDFPETKNFLVLLVVPAFIIGCWWVTPEMRYWVSAMTGAACMLAVWSRWNIFDDLRRAKGGRERYWLVLTLIATNLLGVLVNLLLSTGYLSAANADILKVILGITLTYLATTMLFRIYPLPVQLDATPRTRALTLSPEEKEIADQVRKLMEMDKLYHEPSFNRAKLAQEIGVSESILSKVINVSFGRSFPRLLSEFRVADAKRMLPDSSIPIQVVAFEVGFNSLATFNRVFREVTGETPSGYRARHTST